MITQADSSNGNGNIPPNNGRIFNAPAVVVWLAALLVAVHLFVQFGPENITEPLVFALAFVPRRFLEGGALWPGGEIARVTSFVSYALLHSDWMHLAMNSFWMLAFGSGARAC